MVAEVQMPALSPTMTEGKIVSWNKKEGEAIATGDVILEVETDKAIMEVEAQTKGTLGKILCNADEVVSVGSVIALILEKGENADALKNYKPQNTVNQEVKEEKTDTAQISQTENTAINIKDTENNDKQNNTCQPSKETQRVFATPLAKNIAKMNNIDISTIVSGSGPNGRIIKSDIEEFLKNGSSFAKKTGRNPIEFVDINPNGMRTTVARRLTESKQQVPHWYLKIKVNMSNFSTFRNEVNKMAKVVDGKPEFKISANDIVVMAVAKALQKNPEINACWIDGKIRKYNNVDVSVAVAVDGGIYTPIVKNADQMGLLEISATIKNLAKKARDGKLTPQEFQGGSISISNLGMYGVQEFYSIINQPQSCIIAVGTIENSVVVLDNGQIAVQPTCTITFSADHRVIDGAILAPFANDVKKMLEIPAMMMI